MVRGDAHQSSKGVDLADDDAFGTAADMGVARHVANHVLVKRDQKGPHAKARASMARLDSRVTSPDHDDVKIRIHGSLLLPDGSGHIHFDELIKLDGVFHR